MLGFLPFLCCTSQNSMDPATLNQLVNTEQFTFMARRANPTNIEVINIMNSLPHPAAGTRLLELDHGYTLVLKNKELEVTLPYFGRVFNPTYNPTDNSFRFTSKYFLLTKTLNRKGNWMFTLKPQDVKSVKAIYIEVFKNGKAFVAVDSDDRQPISYDGYLMKNEERK